MTNIMQHGWFSQKTLGETGLIVKYNTTDGKEVWITHITNDIDGDDVFHSKDELYRGIVVDIILVKKIRTIFLPKSPSNYIKMCIKSSNNIVFGWNCLFDDDDNEFKHRDRNCPLFMTRYGCLDCSINNLKRCVNDLEQYFDHRRMNQNNDEIELLQSENNDSKYLEQLESFELKINAIKQTFLTKICGRKRKLPI